ncbi:MAG: hypothetical protein ACOCVZ_03590 [Gemmatimonadota bacterium]
MSGADPSGDCPPEAIAGTITDRPCSSALGVGAGVMLITALEAALHGQVENRR